MPHQHKRVMHSLANNVWIGFNSSAIKKNLNFKQIEFFSKHFLRNIPHNFTMASKFRKPTNHQSSSRNSWFRSLLWIKSFRSLWRLFWNKFWSISKKSTLLRLSRIKNFNSVSLINSCTRLRIKSLSRSTKTIFSLFIRILLSWKLRMFSIILSLMEFHKNHKPFFHFSDSTALSSRRTEQLSSWTEFFQNSFSTCLIFTHTPKPRSVFPKQSFLTSLIEQKFLEKLKRNLCIHFLSNPFFSWLERIVQNCTTRFCKITFQLSHSTCWKWPTTIQKTI